MIEGGSEKLKISPNVMRVRKQPNMSHLRKFWNHLSASYVSRINRLLFNIFRGVYLSSILWASALYFVKKGDLQILNFVNVKWKESQALFEFLEEKIVLEALKILEKGKHSNIGLFIKNLGYSVSSISKS